jgi:hypothetical protein
MIEYGVLRNRLDDVVKCLKEKSATTVPGGTDNPCGAGRR